ncbi:uncharacterized protein EI90DRAFT_3039368 [Cantharellus anzutake]|uniref:uncharacterized protein n=1 Tax=Cantharellus anzutake TaxID=1750568 RepID=UPI001906FCF6|nr:uncharacterized protein EI90DRAFT_3039368 [Cantharellus anzutake]KAF8338846.1 hypothetical protein EI90DRAFT_3039368 [Cantharellus anzutake]
MLSLWLWLSSSALCTFDGAVGETGRQGILRRWAAAEIWSPPESLFIYGLPWSFKRTKKRGRNGPANNTISTMGLPPNGNNTEEFRSNNPGISDCPVSLQNSDAAYRGAPLSKRIACPP